ncbi:MAG: dihydropteroate synthase [Halobacteriales archaeon]|jgi:dihydropteroate synthase
MEYHEAANFLFDLKRFRSKPGTESTADLLSYLGDPHEGFDAIQIAGSNGKGSTARMLERTLRETELTVGFYTQPHLDDVRERIRTDGRKIPRSAVATFLEEVRGYVNERAATGDAPTFFEVMTALALWEFDRQDADVAVLEVGIGGRFDATSVVDPVASAVTSVSLEHTDLIGDSIEEIAHDKAHVAPDDRPLVTGVTGEGLEAIKAVAGDVMTVADGEDADVQAVYGGRTNHTEATVRLSGSDWTVEGRIPSIGEYQAINAGIAATLARQVAAVDEDAIARGLRKAYWPGRMEVMGTDPLVILDGAHNPGAAAALARTLEEFEYDDLHLAVGIMHDKDHARMAEALPHATTVVACEPAIERSEDRDVIAQVFENAGADAVSSTAAVPEAVDEAIAAADPDDLVLVTGSLYAISEARRRWSRTDVPKRIPDRETARAAMADSNVDEDGIGRSTDEAVHRVVKTRVQPRQANFLKQELLWLGGECAISDIRHAEEPLDVVMMGTLSQFERLADVLEEGHCECGLTPVAEEIRETVGLSSVDRGRDYPWEDGTAVMGILNVTPDSFHDGGEYDAVEDAVERARTMIENGADVVDVGGESTRPGAEPVPVEEETSRVVPVIERLADADAMISVDTRKAAVARTALEAGADILNDVSGLADPEMRFLAAEHDVPIVVMHSIDTPVDPENEIEYDDVVEDVVDELTERVLLAEKAGVDREQIIVDPGLGFGKTAAESFELLGRLDEFHALGCPVLVGHSHKSMFEHVGAARGERLEPTVAASAIAADKGADVVRVHDVEENAKGVRVAEAARQPDR